MKILSDTRTLVAISLLMTSGFLHAQSPSTVLSEDTLAVVGGEVITARDLLLRIELMPWAGKDRSSQHESAKLTALYSLVAEKLLAREAFRRGIGEDSETTLMKEVLRRHLVRDELYRREVREKARAEDFEIREGLSRFAKERKLLVYSFDTRKDAEHVYQEWLTAQKIPLVMSTPDTVILRFGGDDVLMEHVSYSLSIGEVSSPFESESGWISVVPIEERPNEEFINKSGADRRSHVERAVRRRNEDILAGSYYAKVLRPQTAEAEPTVFDMFSRALLGIIRRDSLAHRSAGRYMIVPDDVDALLQQFRDSLDTPFVRIADKDMSLGEVIESLRYQRFGFLSLNDASFRRGLNRCVKQIVQGELMAREGIQQNLQYSPRVRQDLSAWSEYWGARMLTRVLSDSVGVGQEELYTYLIGKAGLFAREYQVSIREVLSGSRQEASEHLLAVRGGADLAELARSATIRTDWKLKDGESGFFDVADNPHLGIPALLTSIGTLAGPFQTPQGYSVFRVLGKRKRGGPPLEDSDLIQLEQGARSEYHQKKVQYILNQELVRLANEHRIVVNSEQIQRVDMGSIQMFTRRYLGFGGVMTAFPMLYSIPDWYDVWVRQKPPLP